MTALNHYVTEYTILCDSFYTELAKEVTEHLNSGEWFLVGGPYCVCNSETQEIYHYQALAKTCVKKDDKVTRLDINKKRFKDKLK